MFCSSIVGGIDAEDVAMEAFTKLWENRGRIFDAEHLKRYLFTVARHKSLDIVRRKQVEARAWVRGGLTEDLPDIAGDMDMPFKKVEFIELLSLMLKQLPPKCQSVIDLYFKGYHTKEIAGLLGLEYKTVYSHYTTGIYKMKNFLQKKVDTF